MYVHESNINTKIESDYNNCGKEIADFKYNCYLPMRAKIEKIEIAQATLTVLKE